MRHTHTGQRDNERAILRRRYSQRQTDRYGEGLREGDTSGEHKNEERDRNLQLQQTLGLQRVGSVMSGEILQHTSYILLKDRERNREQELERGGKMDVESAALCQYVLVFDVRTEGLWDSYRRTRGRG